jgi:hypothetical protein
MLNKEQQFACRGSQRELQASLFAMRGGKVSIPHFQFHLRRPFTFSPLSPDTKLIFLPFCSMSKVDLPASDVIDMFSNNS